MSPGVGGTRHSLTEKEEGGCLGDSRVRKLCVEAGKTQKSLTGLGMWERFGVLARVEKDGS